MPIRSFTAEQFHSASKQQEITVARDALSDAYRELKIRGNLQNQQSKEAEEQARKDQVDLDDLGLQARNFRERQ